LIPYSILTVLTSWDDEVVTWIPVTCKHHSIMSFPLERLITWDCRH
jgi:hypothetical protein